MKNLVEGISLEDFFEKLKEKTIQEILIKDGFSCLKELYVGEIDYDTEGDTTMQINNDFMSLDNDLDCLKNFKIYAQKKTIELNNEKYDLKSLNHLFYVDTDFSGGSEKGMMYLKLVNDFLLKNGINKIAYLIHDTRVNENFGLCISDKKQFRKILILFKYLKYLNESNRDKVIEIAKGEPYELRGFELLTNYNGYLIQEGPMIHVKE